MRSSHKQKRGASSSQDAREEPSAPAPASALIPVLTDPRVLKLEKAAAQLGYVGLRPLSKFREEISVSIITKLKHRVGAFVYQAAAYHLTSITKFTAEQIFDHSLVTERQSSHVTWRASTTTELRVLLGSLLEDYSNNCAGISKALRTASERAVRVVATILPPFEVSWTNKDCLYFNLEYCLFDEMGEMHKPKDATRREKLLQPSEVQGMRVAVLQDVLQLSLQDHPLAPGFWQQLGTNDKADEMTAFLAQPQQPARRVALRPAAQPRTFAIDCILDEQTSMGRARKWYLVRWSGYDTSWEQWRIHGEVGSPLETWEPQVNVWRTEAYSAWMDREEEPALN